MPLNPLKPNSHIYICMYVYIGQAYNNRKPKEQSSTKYLQKKKKQKKQKLKQNRKRKWKQKHETRRVSLQQILRSQ